MSPRLSTSAAMRLLAAIALLAAALGAARLTARAWGSVVSYRPPFRFADGESTGGAPLAGQVVVVLVDGLRLDASRQMPFLNRLRAEGADLECSAGIPSYSRPGRAVLATGAGAEIHGATSNFHQGRLDADNLFRAAARAGRSCAAVGSAWQSLFGPDLARGKAAVLTPRVDDARGLYLEREPALRAFASDGIAFLASRAPQLAILDLVVTDYAAHEFGARSEEYRKAARRTDALLEQLARELDLGTTALLVTSDHGHLDEGGHGGSEQEVLATPLVLAGRGVRRGARSQARQVDVAPTVAALLGLPIPGSAQGRILIEALDVDDDTRLALLQMEWRHKQAFAGATEAALGAVATTADPPGEPPGDAAALAASIAGLEERIEAAHQTRITADRRRRLPWFVAAVALPLPALLLLWRRASWRERRALTMGVACYALAFRFLVYARGIRLALSAINHEEDVEPFFLRIGVLALVAILASVVVAVPVARRSGTFATLLDVGLAVSGVVMYVLAASVAFFHWREGLFMEWHRVELGGAFLGLVNLIQIQAVGFGVLLTPLAAWAATRVPALRAAATTAGLLLALATPAPAAQVLTDVPQTVDPKARYLFYLHGRILELQGRHAVSPQHGAYEYDAILKALSEHGFVVISELRGPDTGPEYARKVAGQVRRLLAAGVSPGNVTVAGFSKGGFLALATAAELGKPGVNYVVMAGCGGPPPAFAPRLKGRILSLYDGADEIAGSCRRVFTKAPDLTTRELVLSVGKGHGAFYLPRGEWLEPLLGWAGAR